MYLLLRNNKESGPYTAEQLRQMGLKPYDLIWDEGRSAAWLYPSEIPALKEFAPVVEEQPFDRFYKKPAAAATTKPATAKPKFRISAAWRRIDKEETPATPAPSAETPSWKEAYSEWQQHAPSPTPQPVKQAEKPQSRNQEPAELTTKFEQPLQEIKERYVEHLLTGNKRKNGPTLSVSGKQLMEALLVIGVIALGLWMVFKPEKPENVQAGTTIVAPKQTPNEQKTIVADQDAVEEEQNAVEQQAEPQQTPAPGPVEVPKEHAKTPIYINAAENKLSASAKNQHNEKLLAKTQQKQTGKNLKPATGAPNNIIQQAVNKNTTAVKGNDQLYQTASNTVINPSTVNNAKQQPVVEAPVLPKSNPKTVDELIKVDQSVRYPGVVEDVHLSLKNMTSSTLDLVVVDLQYYDKKGFYKKGETLYIKNVPANRDITVKAPDDLNASNVTYKVSLVSSEQKGLYVVAD